VVVAAAGPHEPARDANPRPPAAKTQTKAAAPAPAAKGDGLPALAAKAAQAVAAPESTRQPADSPEPASRSAREYCAHIADAAANARFAWQKKTLNDLEQEISKRITQLEAKTAEYQMWLVRRDEFSKKAHDSMVTIYARMRPEAAAAQLVAMDEEMAAAVLTKLDPRNASAILNEMDAARAARLTATIGGAANVNLPGRSKAQAGEKKS
jgi:flagellar motility protein MotE (MotC chaperone)